MYLGFREGIRGSVSGGKQLFILLLKKVKILWNEECLRTNVSFSTKKRKLAVVKLCFGQLHVITSSQCGNIIESLGLWYNVTGAIAEMIIVRYFSLNFSTLKVTGKGKIIH